VKELVNKKLLIFRWYQVDVKDMKCFIQLWENDESMFPNIDFFSYQILGTIKSQIEMKRFKFFLAYLLV
jgi:hypothetical protein